MDNDEIEQFIEQAVPDDMSDEAKERFRNLQSNPPSEANAAETTVEEIAPEQLGSLTYVFDMGDSWEHYIELQEIRAESLDGDPAIVGKQGSAPPQYPDLDE